MAEMQTFPLEAAAITFSALGKILYKEPTEELLTELLSPGFFSEIPYKGDDPQVSEGLDILQQWADCECSQNRTESISELNREWLRLMVGYGTPKAPPWLSYYYEKDPLIFGQKTLEVRVWYAKYGLEIERKYHEPDDHLGLMLQFIGAMIEKEQVAIKAGNDSEAEECRADEATFLKENTLPWIAHWQGLVGDEAKSAFYHGLALLIAGTVRSFAQRFWI